MNLRFSISRWKRKKKSTYYVFTFSKKCLTFAHNSESFFCLQKCTHNLSGSFYLCLYYYDIDRYNYVIYYLIINLRLSTGLPNGGARGYDTPPPLENNKIC